MEIKEYQNKIFQIEDERAFNKLCLEAFYYQYNRIDIYQQFVNILPIKLESIEHYSQIPFLPISFFKTHKLISGKAQSVFYSSGTTALVRSKHYIQDLELYENSFFKSFEQFYGKVEGYCILALLPSYLENENSSLVYMIDKLIEKGKNKESGFYLNDIPALSEKLQLLDKQGQKILLLGVSYALLDLIDYQKFELKNTFVMETGGMKGKRKEMIREELHKKLATGFGLENIHSEYGMTELLSQAYSNGNGVFNCPNWMKIVIRDVNDPFDILPNGQSGGINIIDLANIHSVSFIETKDLGKIEPDGDFKILGRFDDSDIRGCNLLIT